MRKPELPVCPAGDGVCEEWGSCREFAEHPVLCTRDFKQSLKKKTDMFAKSIIRRALFLAQF